ncbi:MULTISPECIES: Cro/CI family transcriptional regulator [Sphingobium]|uniref:Cro/CI family transcriptional regulator n=1 Tax=Sphingobium TaxID=165695 RepID=UPI0009B840BC|nr:hypothetical protein CG471_18360 [Sphingobium sp. IP1]
MQKAADIIDALGGTSAVARALEITPSTVSSWKTSGRIPRWRMPLVEALALKLGANLTDKQHAGSPETTISEL